MSYESLSTDSRQLSCDARNIDRVIQSEDFRIMYERASKKHQERIEELIWELIPSKIEHWILSQRLLDIDKLTLRELRLIARKYGIRYYSIKTKGELQEELNERASKAIT
jgi:hypothetical protein